MFLFNRTSSKNFNQLLITVQAMATNSIHLSHMSLVLSQHQKQVTQPELNVINK